MFKRIRAWFNTRLIRKSADTTLNTLNISNASQTPTAQIWRDCSADHSLMFTGHHGEEIFCITMEGEAKWLKEDSYTEAADIFLTYMTLNIEDKVGIIQNRIEWEERITAALVKEAEKSPLGPEDLTAIVRKCIMYDKLKGVKN